MKDQKDKEKFQRDKTIKPSNKNSKNFRHQSREVERLARQDWTDPERLDELDIDGLGH